MIIFIDVDGTLVDYSNKIPASAIKAIRLARQNGHKVFISTGRSKAEVYQNIWDIGLDGMIGGNGSYVEYNEKVIMHQMITTEKCREIVDWLNERGLSFYLECNSGLFGSETFEVDAEPAIRAYASGKGKTNTELLTVRQAFPKMIFGESCYRDDVNKISFTLHTYDDYKAAKEKFSDMVCSTWGGKGEHALFGDLSPDGISKANAIHKTVEALNEDMENTISFGDAKIDIPMFEVCAHSCAMGNGGDETKAAAEYITDDVENDGLYKAFEHFRLI